MKKLIIIFLLSASVSFGQTQINGARIQNNTVTQSKLTADALRPVNSGTLSGTELTFDQVSKKYTLAVTSDIALTLASSGNVADSRINIIATGNGINSLTFPSDWVLDPAGETAFNPNATNKIQLDYDGTLIIVKIIHTVQIIVPTLANAVMDEGTDDLNLTFSFPVTITTAGWTATASGGAVTVSSVVSGSGTTSVVFDLSRNITSGEDMTISYNPATGATVSSTGNEIAAISNTFVDTGEETLPDNHIPVGPARTYTTITAGVNAATSGQTVVVDAGTYRETIPGKTGVTVQPASGETVIVSGLELAGNTGWTVHSGAIYKKTIALPVTGWQNSSSQTSNSNTTILANQIFKDGAMMYEARYPNISTEADLLDISKMRHRSQGTTYNETVIVDSGLPASPGNADDYYNGARIVGHGWFWPRTRIISDHDDSEKRINFPSLGGGDARYRKYWYIVGKLGLLDIEKEWHYEGGILYFRQVGGASPTGVEYKARNWGFDLRGVDNFVIKGLHFIGCDPAHGDTQTDNCTVDNIRATYMNHDNMTSRLTGSTYDDHFPGYGNAKAVGTRLTGSGNTVKNSEFQYSASQAVWVGPGGRIENNLFEDIGYDGTWACPANFWSTGQNVVITRNTMFRTGRSAVDMGFTLGGFSGPATNLNIEVSYNDMSMWGMLCIDLGAIYSWGYRNLTGSSYHHNWFHDDGVVADPSAAALDGGQRAVYFDQGSGPVTVHHNVFYNNWTGTTNNTGDIYSQMEYTGGDGFHRSTGGQFFYNNTIISTEGQNSYTTYETSGVKDKFRNNIFREIINLRWGLQGSGYTPDEQYNTFDIEVTNLVMTPGTGSLKNQDFATNFFLGSGTGGLFYRPHASSTTTIRNQGVVIEGITDDDDASPDKGAYKFADNDDPWIPGYNAVAIDDEVNIENDNLVFTSYSVTPTIFNNAVFSGGNSSYFNNAGTITVTFTGTAFEWWAEKSDNKAIIEVQVDNVRQDCDTGTGGTQDCDCYAATAANNSQLIFSKTGLSAGSHTIELINLGTKNASSTDYFIVHDKIVTP